MNNDDKWPPNDAVAEIARKEEQRLLSLILKNKDCLADIVSSKITADYFRFSENKYLYSVMLLNYEAYQTLLTMGAIDSILEGHGEYSDEQRTSIKQKFGKVYSTESDPEEYKMLKQHLFDRFRQKKLWLIFESRAKEVTESTSGQTDILNSLKEEIGMIESQDVLPYGHSVAMSEVIDEVWKHIEERRDHPEKIVGIKSGLGELDKIYCGFEKGSYLVVAGAVNGGKTTLMYNMGFNMAYNGNIVYYVSLEKLYIPFFERVLAMHALVDSNAIRRGGKGEWGLNDYAMDRLSEARADLEKNKTMERFVCIEKLSTTTLSVIISEIEKKQKERKHDHIDVLVLDYLGCVGFEPPFHSGRPDLDLAAVSKKWQAYGRQKKALTITAVQIKNESTKKIREKLGKSEMGLDDLSVGTEDLAGSQQVIADADIGLSVFLNNDKPPTEMGIHLTKSRDSQSKVTLKFDFDPNTGKIADKILEQGQVKAVDKGVYGEESVKFEENLFDGSNNKADEKETSDQLVAPNHSDESIDFAGGANDIFGDTDGKKKEDMIDQIDKLQSEIYEEKVDKDGVSINVKSDFDANSMMDNWDK